MKLFSILFVSALLSACAKPRNEAEYKADGYCLRGKSWYPVATIIDLKAGKKIICVDGYWEQLSI